MDRQKSKPYLGWKGRLENRRSLPYCKIVEKNVELGTPCEAMKMLKGRKHIIRCDNCNRVSATVFLDEDDNIFNFETGEILSVIKRKDGLLGIQCPCGQDTREGERKEAHWNEKGSKFIIEERKE